MKRLDFTLSKQTGFHGKVRHEIRYGITIELTIDIEVHLLFYSNNWNTKHNPAKIANSQKIYPGASFINLYAISYDDLE